MSRMPTLFLSHGGPTTVADPDRPGVRWPEIAARLPRPRAIVMASAHWLTAQPCVSNSPAPETIHDFYGFPAELYEIQYPAPGAPALAADIARLLEAAGLPAAQAPYGLDHGGWMPGYRMYPEADIPVLQLAIQPRLGPAHHWRVGEALRSLRDDGVLIIGSGQLTHNLRERYADALPGQRTQWAEDFVAWMTPRIEAMERDALCDYRQQAPHAARAHPTDEHLLPLFVAMGAAAPGAVVKRLPYGFYDGTISFDSFIFSD